MKSSTSIAACTVVAVLAIFHQLSLHSVAQGAQQLTVLFDGTNLNAWNPIGNANWKVGEGVVQANSGNGFLVTKESHQDFELKVEFWVDEEANSGVHPLRKSDAD